MVVSFDKFKNAETPVLTLCNPCCTYNPETGALSHPVGVIAEARNVEILYKFNAPSELNFTIDKHCNMFAETQNRRLVFVDGIGFYYIIEVTTSESDSGISKEVSGRSCEIDLMRKVIPYFSDEDAYSLSECFDKLREEFPMWDFPSDNAALVNPIPGSISTRRRVFEDLSEGTNIYAFIISNLQEAFGCVFEVDYLTRRLTCYDAATYIEDSLAYIPGDGLADSISVTRTSDDVCTALTVYGDNDLSVAQCYPLGISTVYDFSGFYEQMPPELGAKVEDWQVAVSAEEASYATLNSMHASVTSDIVALESDVARYGELAEVYKSCKANLVASDVANLSIQDVGEGYNDTVSSLGGEQVDLSQEFNDLLSAVQSNIDLAKQSKRDAATALATAKAQLADINAQIAGIQNNLALSTYFTPEELDMLSAYTIEGNWNYEYATQTEQMSVQEILEQARILYDAAKEQLQLRNAPLVEVTADMRAFAFLEDYAKLTASISIGRNKIDLSMRDDSVVYSLFLTEVTVNYEDRSFSLAFANKIYKPDDKTLYTDLFGEISRTTNAISRESDSVYPVVGSRLDALNVAAQNSLRISLEQALGSQNNVVTIDDTGYLGTTLDDGDVSPEQIKITNNSIVFTDDNWDSAATAIGPIAVGGDKYVYGINGRLIVGRIIAGVAMQIGADETAALGDILGEMKTKLDTYEHEVGAQGEWLTFDSTTGLVIGQKLVDSSGVAFYSVQTGASYKLLSTASPTTPIAQITSIDAALRARSVESDNKISAGGFDAITTSSGLAVKWRGE